MAELSRRNFIAGAAGALGAAALGLAWCASASEGSGLSNTGADTDRSYDFAADVVVVGSGGAGFMACVGAHQNGASSLLIEKADLPGGDSRMCHQDILAFWPERTMADGGVEDTFDKYLADWCASRETASVKGLRGDALSDELPYCERFMNTFSEVGDFLVNDAKVMFEPIIMGASMANVEEAIEPRTWHGMSIIVQNIQDLCETWDDFTLLTDSEVNTLLKDETGRINGVTFTTKDGSVKHVRANKAVVMATGTFNANPSMVARYIDPVYAGFTTCGSRYNTGDGHKMVQQAGGALRDMDLGMNWENAPRGTNNIWLLDNYLGSFGTHKDAIAPTDPAICVNLAGKRYVNESLGYNGMGRETAKQQYGVGYYMGDSTLGNEFLEGCDLVYWGDTLDELAEKMCVNPEALKAEIDRYNSFVDGGADEDFGKNVTGATRIEKAPFYAVTINPQHYVTLGGIKTDIDSHVLDADDNPLPGLYAAGMCCGSYWEQQGVLYYGGFNQALTFGYQAGRNAAAEAGEGDTFGEAPVATAEPEKAAPATAHVDYADGTYQGTGTGMGGKINMTVEVSGGKVTVTDISPNNETPGIGGYEAIEDGTFKNAIEAAQSADIDVITGATVTSRAIIAAASEALNQAVA